jgi:formate dehydrogenase subunit delta
MSHENGRRPDKLIYMANQIGKFWASQDREKAPEAIAQHLKKFWDPRMRERILALAAGGGDGLDPVVRTAVQRLALEQTKPSPPRT